MCRCLFQLHSLHKTSVQRITLNKIYVQFIIYLINLINSRNNIHLLKKKIPKKQLKSVSSFSCKKRYRRETTYSYL